MQNVLWSLYVYVYEIVMIMIYDSEKNLSQQGGWKVSQVQGNSMILSASEAFYTLNVKEGVLVTLEYR